MVANYATQPMTGRTATGADFFVGPGSQRDSITDAAVIAFWAGNFTANAPVAGAGNVTGVLAQYLAAYPKGP